MYCDGQVFYVSDVTKRLKRFLSNSNVPKIKIWHSKRLKVAKSLKAFYVGSNLSKNERIDQFFSAHTSTSLYKTC